MTIEIEWFCNRPDYLCLKFNEGWTVDEFTRIMLTVPHWIRQANCPVKGIIIQNNNYLLLHEDIIHCMLCALQSGDIPYYFINIQPGLYHIINGLINRYKIKRSVTFLPDSEAVLHLINAGSVPITQRE